MNTFAPFHLLIPRPLVEEMVEHARAELPNECCGLLAGRMSGDGATGEVTHHYSLVNEAASPTEFLSEPYSMLHAVRDMRANEIDVLAVYHSHPASPPVPSRRDLELSYNPWVVNLIISLATEPPEVRAWWLTEADYRTADWQVIG